MNLPQEFVTDVGSRFFDFVFFHRVDFGHYLDIILANVYVLCFPH